jgi:ABC-type transporter Mla MlaB component
MLRITEETATENITLLRLEGRLVDEWVELLHAQIVRHVPATLVLELSGVSYANQEGLCLLREWQTRGVTLRNGSLFLHEMLRSAASTGALSLRPPLNEQPVATVE